MRAKAVTVTSKLSLAESWYFIIRIPVEYFRIDLIFSVQRISTFAADLPISVVAMLKTALSVHAHAHA